MSNEHHIDLCSFDFSYMKENIGMGECQKQKLNKQWPVPILAVQIYLKEPYCKKVLQEKSASWYKWRVQKKKWEFSHLRGGVMNSIMNPVMNTVMNPVMKFVMNPVMKRQVTNTNSISIF